MHSDAPDERPRSAPAGRLLRPAAACPRCGGRPALRVTEPLVRALEGQDPGTAVVSYQCHRRGCGAVYTLSAASLQEAA